MLKAPILNGTVHLIPTIEIAEEPADQVPAATLTLR